MMEEKISKSAPKDERLVIYTQQAQQIARKKEKATEELKRTEEEQITLEKKVQAQQEKLNKEKGKWVVDNCFRIVISLIPFFCMNVFQVLASVESPT